MLMQGDTTAKGCPFPHAAGGAATKGFRRGRLGLQGRAVRDEIAKLDATRDAERIVFLLTSYEFPFDMTRALELALFHTYGSRSVSKLLDRTKQFENHGQRRYDDTNLLIGLFVETGWSGGPGKRAIDRMNAIHSLYRIANEDFLFVLWTFMDFPIQWTRDFGWRALTQHEETAWFTYWRTIGEKMNIADIPTSKAAYDRFIEDYESREMVFDEANANVARATLRILEAWLPKPMRPLVQPIAACLLRPRFLAAAGLPPPRPWQRAAVRAALKLRARVRSVVSLEVVPSLVSERVFRSYPRETPAVEDVGPAAREPASHVA